MPPWNYYGLMSDTDSSKQRSVPDLSDTADKVIEQLHAVDEKVNELARQRKTDRDTLGDKIIKAATPALAGLVAGKAFSVLWDKLVASGKSTSAEALEKNQGMVDDDVQRKFWTSLLFVGLSAAFAAVVQQLSDSGSKAFVARRHNKRNS